MFARSGNRCEAAVLSAMVDKGLDVLVPFGEGHPYDLVVVANGTFVRVQCKTARSVPGALVFNAYSTDHGKGQGSYVGRSDVFGVHFPPVNQVYLVPVGLVASECRLRLAPARNNQQRRVRLASDYEFSRWTTEALAALAGSAGEVA